MATYPQRPAQMENYKRWQENLRAREKASAIEGEYEEIEDVPQIEHEEEAV